MFSFDYSLGNHETGLLGTRCQSSFATGLVVRKSSCPNLSSESLLGHLDLIPPYFMRRASAVNIPDQGPLERTLFSRY